jgi:hypothetical protein
MPAIWLALPIVVLAAFYGTALYASDGYGLGATAMATGVLPFVGGFVAATAAWEGARLRRAVWWTPIVRSRLIVAGWAVLPSVAAGFLAVLAATAVLLVRSGATVPDLCVLAVVLLDLVAWASVGFALGILLRVPVAIPAGILLPLLWFAFVPAFYPVWLRHVTGMFRDCCGLSEDLSAVAVIASVLADLGMLLAAAVAIGARASLRRRAASLASFVVPVALALALVSGMGSTPTVPRDPSLLACQAHSGATLCTWPEHAAIADDVLAIVVSARKGWQAAGIESPALVTEAGRSTAAAGSIPILINDSTPDDVILALAAGLVPTQPDCQMGSTGGIAVPWLEAWYAATGGMSRGRLQEEFGYSPQFLQGTTTLDPLHTVDALWKVSADARRAWVAHGVSMVTTCDVVEQDLTVRP